MKAGTSQRNLRNCNPLKWAQNWKEAKGRRAPPMIKGSPKKESSSLVSSLKVAKVSFCFCIYPPFAIHGNIACQTNSFNWIRGGFSE